MPNYDFTSLSSHDFEQLTRDLLQLKLNVTLESFKQGRDKGIDLRYSTPRRPLSVGRRDIIIQCKHYAATPYSTLISQLRAKEVPKVQTLNPQRYILATSVGLTPQNKTEIINAFVPFIQGPADVLGRDDLNNLLEHRSGCCPNDSDHLRRRIDKTRAA